MLNPPSPAATPRRTRTPRFRRRTWFGVGLLLGAVVLLICYCLARSTPSWYQPLNANANDVIDDADVAQNKLRFEIHNTMERVPLGPQQWKITQHQVDSLLAIRFSPAADNPATKAAPPQEPLASSPFVLFTPGEVTVGVRSPKIPGSDPAGGLLSVSFSVETSTAPDGSPMGAIHIGSAHIGLLPIPRSIVQSKLQSMVPGIAAVAQQTMTYQLGVRDASALMPQVETAIRAIANGEPFPLHFRYDRREVVIQEIRVDDGLLTITFVPPTPAGIRPR
ncbi:MAG TPA: hypothetical protein VM008_04170 [Phycisphaerae bacterium]|nr:hypothetical protein [Phycisphaerae bacterium]